MAVSGFEAPSAGTVRIGGEDLRRWSIRATDRSGNSDASATRTLDVTEGSDPPPDCGARVGK